MSEWDIGGEWLPGLPNLPGVGCLPGECFTHPLLAVGPIPGAAEQGALHQVGAAPAARAVGAKEEPGCDLWELHPEPAETAGRNPGAAGAAGVGAAEHAAVCRGLQNQVSWSQEQLKQLFGHFNFPQLLFILMVETVFQPKYFNLVFFPF